MLELGVLGVALGLGLGIPTSLVYHAKLARVLAARGELPPRWWLSPTRLHTRLRGAERRAVLRWFYRRRRRLRDHARRLRGGVRRRAAGGIAATRGRSRQRWVARRCARARVSRGRGRACRRAPGAPAQPPRRPGSCDGCRVARREVTDRDLVGRTNGRGITSAPRPAPRRPRRRRSRRRPCRRPRRAAGGCSRSRGSPAGDP